MDTTAKTNEDEIAARETARHNFLNLVWRETERTADIAPVREALRTLAAKTRVLAAHTAEDVMFLVADVEKLCGYVENWTDVGKKPASMRRAEVLGDLLDALTPEALKAAGVALSEAVHDAVVTLSAGVSSARDRGKTVQHEVEGTFWADVLQPAHDASQAAYLAVSRLCADLRDAAPEELR